MSLTFILYNISHICTQFTVIFHAYSNKKQRHGPVGLIHIDAHDDFEEQMCGSSIAHGNVFF